MAIKKGDTTYTGVKLDEEGNIVCEVCGGNKVTLLFHADAAKYCTSAFKCECGNQIEFTTPRSKNSPMYYETDEE